MIRKSGDTFWRPDNPKSARKKKSAILLVTAVVLFALDFGGASLYAALWHFLNPRPVKCGDFSIRVPSRWWAKNQGCTLITPSPAYSLRVQEPVQLFFNLVSTPSVNDPKWRTDVEVTLQGDGNTLTSSKELTVAGVPTVCFEYLRPSKPNLKSAIICNVDRKMVVTFFYDDAALANEFYTILRTVQYSTPPSKPQPDGTAGY